MNRMCPVCDQNFKSGDMIEVMVVAEWIQIPSEKAYKIGKPVEAYVHTLRHHDCFNDLEGPVNEE